MNTAEGDRLGRSRRFLSSLCLGRAIIDRPYKCE